MKKVIFVILFFCAICCEASVFCVESILLDGIREYKLGNYKTAIDRFIDVLSDDPQNSKARKYLKMSSNNLLEDERKAIKKERLQFVKDARKSLKKQQKQNVIVKKDIKPFLSEAKKYYKKKWYLFATDRLSEIILKYPDCRSAKYYYKKIKNDMELTAKNEQTTDLEGLSYARGYVFYYEQQFVSAINEWKKALEINPERNELQEYVTTVEAYLKDAQRLAKEKKIEERVSQLFNDGVKNFNDKQWVGSIRKMESVQQICQNETFPKALNWHSAAQEYIIKAIRELSKTVAKNPKKVKPVSTVSEQEIEIDIAGAEKKYTDGLVMYAQGRLFDAQKMWEVAARLNPNHEKARKALEKVKKELESQE